MLHHGSPTTNVYVITTLMTELINSEPSSFEEAALHDVWKEAMFEEYKSIMKN